MKFSLKLFLALFFVSGVRGELPSEIRVDDGTGAKVYEIACDELYCRPELKTPHLISAPDQGTAAKVRTHAAEKEAVSGARFDLVLYEKGVERSRKTRRTLSRQILVEMTGEILAAEIAAASGAESFEVPSYSDKFVVLTFGAVGESLEKLGDVVALDGVLSAKPLVAKRKSRRHTPNDPRYAWSAGNTNYQWHLNNTGQNGSVVGLDANVDSVWDTYKGSGITVSVVDDGLQVAHEDLAANANTAIDHDWNDGTPDDSTPPLQEGLDGFWSHGTSVGGVIAGRGDNGIGITGAAPLAQLVGLKILTADTTEADDAAALGWRTDVIDISNNSWGEADDGRSLFTPSAVVKAALASGVKDGRNGLGTIYVWSAGNGREDGDYAGYDGYVNQPETIGVGAVSWQGEQSWYSESGANVLISAPSDFDFGDPAITTTTITTDGTYTDTFGGTSSAAPLVSGVVALLLESKPTLGWRDVQEILIRSARKVDAMNPGWSDNGAGFHFHHGFGAGMVDAGAAVALASSWQNLGTQMSSEVSASSINTPIPDNSAGGVTRTLTLSGADVRVEHALLTVDIDHTNRGHLEISLTSPSGTVSELAEVHSDPGDNYRNYEFLSVRSWGELANGDWTLKVADRRSGTTGTLRSASLKVLGTSALSGYEAWVASSFPSGALMTGELDDPDGDGRKNLMEYALNKNPLVQDPGDMEIGSVVSFQADTAKSDIGYVLRSSTDLKTWTVQATTVSGVSGTVESRQAVVPTSGVGRIFYRLEVSRAN